MPSKMNQVLQTDPRTYPHHSIGPLDYLLAKASVSSKYPLLSSAIAVSSTRKVLRVGKTYHDTPTLRGAATHNNIFERSSTISFIENRTLGLDLYLHLLNYIADSAV